MSSERESDPLIRGIASLPPVVPDAARAERVRARCRATLERRQQPDPLAHLEPAAAGAVCAAYAWQIARMTMLLLP